MEDYRSDNKTTKIAIIVVIVLVLIALCCCCMIAGGYLLRSDIELFLQNMSR